ncbi:MAG: hypothetical protein RSB82_02150 [Victivallaceae bacterium]
MIIRSLIGLLALVTQAVCFPVQAVSYLIDNRKEQEKIDLQRQFRPFSWQTQGFCINKADFKKLKNQSIGYQQFDTTFTATIPCNELSGFIVSCGGVIANIDWDTNKIFRDKSAYAYTLMSVGGYTLALPRWNWSILFSVLTDPEKFGSFNYNIYQLVMCGRYKASDVMEITMGVVNEAGLRQEKAWPLVGLSCKPCKDLTVNLIYPNNFSIDYACSSICRFGTSFRIIRFRKRLHENAILSKGIFEYENQGLEANIKIIPSERSYLKVFGGIALGKGFSFADRKNHAQITEKFKDSGYFGGNFVISF